MDSRTRQVLELEELEKFEDAFHAYELLDYQNTFEHWKPFYFFLWYMNVEDVPLGTTKLIEKYNLDEKLKKVTNIGFRQFSANSQFKFVAGYTISLFPYYYGDYEEWENKGNELLKAAYEQEPDNIIFELAFNGSSFGSNEQYNKTKPKASEAIRVEFSGKGLLNSYFGEVLGTK